MEFLHNFALVLKLWSIPSYNLMLPVKLLNNPIKRFTARQNYIFLASSLSLLWSWMFVTALIDRGDNRGLLTVFGYVVITALVFSLFLSSNKIVDFFRCFIYLGLSSAAIFVLSFTLGLYLIHITGLNWTGPIVTIIATGLLIFYSLRCLISFPNNVRAFWTVFLLPIFLIIVLNLPTFDSSFNQEYGIGFSFSIYLSSLFIAIAVLCRGVEV